MSDQEQGGASNTNSQQNQNTTDFEQVIEKMDYHIRCKQNAQMRLLNNSKWLQWLSIYYSCFTVVLSIVGLKHSEISEVSIIFTVVVAIMVASASGFNFEARANDIRVNIMDLQTTLEQYKIGKTDIIDFNKKLYDSEEVRKVDQWKAKEKKKWYEYVKYEMLFCVFIGVLILLPIVFCCVNSDVFKEYIFIKVATTM